MIRFMLVLIAAMMICPNSIYASNVTRNTISGNALYFDGLGDFLQISYDPSLMLGNQYTYETWYKADSFDDTGTFFSKSLHSSPYEFKEFYITSDVKLATLGWNPTGFGSSVYTSTNIIQTGIWYHLAAVYNGSFVTFYVDGQQVGAAINASGDIYDSTALAYIGRNANFSVEENTLHGTLDEFRFYGRALSSAEILQAYNNGISGIESTVSNTALRGYWAFDEGEGSNAYDSSTFTNNASFGVGENSPLWIIEANETIPEPLSILLLASAMITGFIKYLRLRR